MAFFTQDFLDFFSELKENNHKDWFDEHRKRYLHTIKKPFEEFVDRMIDLIHEEDPQVMIAPKDAIFRINRDIRFSKDKRPYKENVSALISPIGKKDKLTPGFYFELSPAAIGVYGGIYFTDKDTLSQIRHFMAADLPAFNRALYDKTFRETYGEIHGDKHKRLPKDLQEPAKQQPLIFNKTFYYYTHLPAANILADDLDEQLMELYRAGTPMKNYLTQAIGQPIDQ
ncbi:DUF2461 domain-containing protein [Pontibacter sp. G13]|uniref:DUF2461 domain-containing protein n=1 Tax=Pontibacter sp. G13 TaxID=3074898 RepID=UPI00288A0381|nr:DUF2461 domain-containing protein [Pontibacter sp. G13]WNJ20769.1 DUF2461 domain-containing protein [Pontibacter sp. G13]